MHYVLNKETGEIKEVLLIDWATWLEDPKNKIIKQEYVGEYWVSTVFLGIDHSFSSPMKLGGPPVLFETMIFPVKEDPDTLILETIMDEKYCDRYCTMDEALEGHKIAVRLAATKAFIADPDVAVKRYLEETDEIRKALLDAP